MRSRYGLARVTVMVTLIVMLFTSAFGLAATTRAQANQAYELFTSPQTGYFTFWNPLVWTREGQSSTSNGDWIRLHDEQDDLTAEFFAFLAPGISTTDCARTILDQLAGAPSTESVEALTEEGGPPQISDASNDFIDARSSTLVLAARGDDGPEKFAVKLECQEIVPGESILARTLQVPSPVYNMNGLDLFWQELDFGLFEQLTREDHALPIPDASGQVAGTVAAMQSCLAFPLFGLARGTSASDDFVVEPSAFMAVGFAGQPLPFSLVWSLPVASSTSPIALQTGEFALFQIVEDQPDDDIADLYYSPSGATPIRLSHFEDGCGAGGGAPVLIDVD